MGGPQAVKFFCEHDPTFMMPLAAVAVSWLAVKRSKHPWAINVREGWSPLWLGVALV